MEFLDLNTISVLAAFSISLAKIWSALSVVLGLGMVIFFHELGHFAVAKWCDVHVERFSIGIGPIIWSRQKGETEYALSALPFGGYVKMLGQDDMDSSQMTSDEIAENPRSYTSKKVWQRMAIISAGVIMNVITGFMFFAIAYRYGVVETVPMVGNVVSGTPAWRAGLEPGDTIDRINGEEVQNFMDINQGVVLSDGPVTLEGTKKDGTEFSKIIAPELTSIVRTIGVSYASTSKIATLYDEKESLIAPGLAAEKASQEFKRGDRIVALNDQPISFLHEMSQLTAKDADKEIVYRIERPIPDSDGEIASDAKTEEVAITVPPRKMKTTGLWMAIGPVSVLRDDSVAAMAGLQINDQIIKVGDLKVGDLKAEDLEASKMIDPLRLPNYFAEHAGEEVKIIVKRQTDEEGKDEVPITLIPENIAGWSSRPESPTSSLLIPSIGAGIHVQPRIAHIVPDSEAGSSTPEFAPGQKITKVELIHPDPKNIVKDGIKDDPAVIDIAEIETDKEEHPGNMNWAYVHWMMQQVPNRHVRIHVGDSANAKEAFVCTLSRNETVDGWYSPIRGIRGWESHSRIRKADSWSAGAAQGYRQTKSSGISIYMTLRSLMTGNLNVRALSGPLGIVSIGYMVAEDGMTRLLKFLGFLSINLAVLNFLPIPVLDGGHMVFLIWEGVARKKPSPKIINIAHGIGLVFIISLFVFVMYQDIFVNKFGFGG